MLVARTTGADEDSTGGDGIQAADCLNAGEGQGTLLPIDHNLRRLSDGIAEETAVDIATRIRDKIIDGSGWPVWPDRKEGRVAVRVLESPAGQSGSKSTVNGRCRGVRRIRLR